MANYGTGIVIECPCCGATEVPVKWGGEHGEMKARVHAAGVRFSQNYYGLGKCYGPADVFLLMLAESRMALTGPNSRYATLDEQRNGMKVGPA
ncbi:MULTISPECIES: hypothetical protein [Gordonia]|uniref:Uncharacterized protein n=1 Tax=Gordonia sihwensis NBRC 108236 TaxID=1223544 RepID=L7LN04_9ACTN|nr:MULTISPECIES: hypothetical protein [Gordonia]GAC62121.1 hypothetical protein GSI01S_29_00090 [Gordonia sihwensis NBRC 108236]